MRSARTHRIQTDLAFRTDDGGSLNDIRIRLLEAIEQHGSLTRGAKGPPTRPPHEGEARNDFQIYELGAMPLGQPFDLVVDGLVTRPRLYQRLGLGLGLAVALACGLAFALRPRASLQARLIRRRDALLKKLEAATPDARPALIDALDQIFCQLDALGSAQRHADPGAAWSDKPSDKRSDKPSETS